MHKVKIRYTYLSTYDSPREREAEFKVSGHFCPNCGSTEVYEEVPKGYTTEIEIVHYCMKCESDFRVEIEEVTERNYAAQAEFAALKRKVKKDA